MKLLAHLLFISLIITSFPVYSQTKQDGKGVGVRNISQLPSKDKRWALIIGVDDYQDDNISDLRGAANDAKALADSLERYAGFPQDQIVLLTTSEPSQRQPTRANILRRISNLKSLVPKDGLLLVSFSGHGIERSNRAFLIPSDATSTEDIDLLEETALSVESMKRQVKSTGVQQVLFFLDACRNDPTSGRSESTNPLTEAYKRGFSFDVANKEIEAFATIYATSVGARAYEFAEKRQGYFSWAIVEGLSGKAANSNGEVTLGSLVKYVAERVPKMVQIDLGGSKLQRPFAQIEGYKADELVIAIGGSVQPMPTPRPIPNIVNSKSGEDVLWEEVTRLNSRSAYQSYLNEYPSGKFASTARLKIQNIDTEAINSAKQIESQKWEEAERSNTIESYRNYLNTYPNGEYKGLANLRINNLLETTNTNNKVNTSKNISLVSIEVLADNTANGWTNTGIVVGRGNKIKITPSGSINLGKEGIVTASGDNAIIDKNKLLKNKPTGSLIAVIGADNNDFYYVGGGGEIIAQRSGLLFLGINEGNLDDNSGSFDVKIEAPKFFSDFEKNVTVFADDTANGWTNTAIIVNRGDIINITPNGKINLGNGRTVTAGGDFLINDYKKLLKDKPTGAIIGVIGDDNNDFFHIGAGVEFTAERSGVLFLGVNEGNLSDNLGYFEVKIAVKKVK